MPDNLHPWRRFFAFYFDVLLFMLPFELVWIFIDLDAYSYFSTLYSGVPMALLKAVTALPLMALFICKTKTTPGKWLMGIKLTLPPEANFTRLYKRTVYAFVLGAGMWLATVCWFLLFLSYRTLKLTGVTSWDKKYSTRVSHSRLHGGKIAAFVAILLAGSVLETLPANLDLIQRVSAYSYSPAYCEISVSSGSLAADAAQLEISVETMEGAAQIVYSGGAYSIDRRLSELKSLTVKVSGDFHVGLPGGLEIELLMKDIPNAVLSLAVEASIVQNPDSGDITVFIDAVLVDRYSQKVVYSRNSSHAVDPGFPHVGEVIGG